MRVLILKIGAASQPSHLAWRKPFLVISPSLSRAAAAACVARGAATN
jgi:hypothetical protein